MVQRELEEAIFRISKAAKRLKNIESRTKCRIGKCSKDKLISKYSYLYELKKKMILKAIEDGWAKKYGIHRVKKSNGIDIDFVYIKFPSRSFHIPLENEEDFSLTYLGEWKKRNNNRASFKAPLTEAIKVSSEYLK